MFPVYKILQGVNLCLYHIITKGGNHPPREVIMIKNRKLKSAISVFVGVFIFLFPVVGFSEELLVPIGQTVGVTMNMKGITVVDIADIESCDGSFLAPAKQGGIRVGDFIESVNGKLVSSVKDFEELIANSEDEVEIVVRRDDKKKTFSVKPVLSSQDNKYRLGVWVKDAVSGIGTITYLNPETGEFGGLGHGIAENENGDVIEISDGEVLDARVVSIQKGGKGQPGELVGIFTEEDEVLGHISENTAVGIKGEVSGNCFEQICEAMPVAKREEVKTGKAEIVSNIEEGKIEKFEVEIQKINRDTDNPKGMVIKVTDKKLLEKTGGIVQGMSGSPIIQNGKLIGAVTHVFVNDPTRGYGIFIENMLDEAKK